jgi:dihydroorotase
MLIKNGLLLDPVDGQERKTDILIKEGVVAKIAPDLPVGEVRNVLDASNLWIAPGFIDIHTHLREIGQADREDVGTGTMAAAAGGYTCVVTMANTEPPIDNGAILRVLLEKIEEKAHIEVLPIACVTKGMEGNELTNMVELAELGVAAFSDDGKPVSNLAVLRRALQYAAVSERVIISHPEDEHLSGGGVIHEGLTATKLGLPAIPGASEAACISREIEVVRETGGRLHFGHVSLEASVNLIRRAKADGLPVTADATPHHITLTVDDIVEFDSNYKMNPPLRTAADVAALVAGLADGTIDAIATDHAPHTSLDKEKPFEQAPFGVIGLETAFSLSYERLVKGAGVAALDFIAMLTTRPAAVLDLPAPSISEGQPASLVILDPQHTWIYDAKKGFSKSSNSPFSGRKLTGKALLTFCRGTAVYKDERLLAARLSQPGVGAGS